MAERIREDLWRIEVPLRGNPLKSINAYLLTSPAGNLLIDTGLNRPECLEAVLSGLADAGADLEETDFFVTHMHADHFGLVPRLLRDARKVYFNRPDAEVFKDLGHWEEMLAFAARHGFPEDELRAALHSHPGYKHGAVKVPPLTLLEDGDEISVGDYRLRCVQTPGHSPGHLCLYEEEKRLLFSGDHILGDITPNIQCWREGMDPLADYLRSLEKVSALEVDLVLPGHRSLIRNCRGRIEELKIHHRRRAEEILRILEAGPMTAYRVASQMSWDIDCASWEVFPVAQKWFATGEAIAHLRYLEGEGRVRGLEEAGRVVFSRHGG